jgi:ribosome-associated protein
MARTRKNNGIAGKKLARMCVQAVEEKKSLDPVVLDMRGLSTLTDYFVICSGTSDRQVKAIAEHVVQTLKKQKVVCYRSEGWLDAHWIILDYLDVIVHVFLQEARDYYQIERLWGDAKKVPSSRTLPAPQTGGRGKRGGTGRTISKRTDTE